MATYLVTGGAGFIGSHIAETLVRRGDTVRVLDDLSTGNRRNLGEFSQDLEFIEGDIRDAETVLRAVDGVDFVLHQAALASVPRSLEDPLTTTQVNVDGTLNLLDAARRFGVERFVYASSSSVYGDSETLPKVETMRAQPKSPYAVSKLAGEWYARVFSEAFDLPTVGLRYFNVFGPRQDPNSQYSAVIPLFSTSLIHGTRATIFGDGEQSRDFTYIENVVSANLLACQSPHSGARVYNVACGERFTLKQLYDKLQDIVGVRSEAIYADERPGDVKHSQADIGAIVSDLGYKTSVGFEEGLRKTVQWYRDVELAA